MNIWFEGYELVVCWRDHGMVVIGPRTLAMSVVAFGRERGFLLHPGQSTWL
jgi:hypothetical protein